MIIFSINDYEQKILIYDICKTSTIVTLDTPYIIPEYLEIPIDGNIAELITEHNFILLFNYRMLYDLNNN